MTDFLRVPFGEREGTLQMTPSLLGKQTGVATGMTWGIGHPAPRDQPGKHVSPAGIC